MITEEIKRKGFYCNEELLTTQELNKMQEFVKSKLAEFPNKNFRLYEDSFKNSILDELQFNSKIEELVNRIIEDGYKDYKKKKPNIFKVLRIVSGSKQKEQAYLYHFDAHIVTILIPIIIPNNPNKKNGDLVLFPNIRNVHNNLTLNIIQKIFFQNYFIRNLLKFNSIKKLLNHKIVKIKPGNIYAFNGFSSLHGNLEIDVSSTRATLLVHAYDVFEKSKLVNLNREISMKKENKNIS